MSTGQAWVPPLGTPHPRLFSITLCYRHRPPGPLHANSNNPHLHDHASESPTGIPDRPRIKWAGSAEKSSLFAISMAMTGQNKRVQAWVFRTRVVRPQTNHSLSGTQSPNLQNTAYLTSCQDKPRQHWRMSFVNGESFWHIPRAPRWLTQTCPRSKTLSDIMTS